MKKKNHIHIGTSGWSYEHWKENFYPKGLGTKKWLHYYSEHFPTVEINSTFYRLPRATTIKDWHNQVPKDFLFAIKASRYITHIKRLHDCKDSVEYLLALLEDLKPKLGPILIQLPPSFKMNKERLLDFLGYLKKDFRYVFEFRHDSWYKDEIYDYLHKHKIGLCITDLNGIHSPEVITTDFTYMRLHGPHKAYVGSYGPEGLKMWRKKIEKWSENASVYCYFDNDEKGYAIKDAAVLQEYFATEA